ncbi:uncharacterized protein LOC107040584 [Diachasma alloeum]|uniref:uncharacterized protein LOC107040584 n=1 Tax=Diachasma alloeum TaxID=454923 RepID=UPI0007382CE9|nr:uncharacterized protein LOC107040584 [Diachasma alloeum]
MSEKAQENTPQSINNSTYRETNSKSSASEKREVNELKIQNVDELSYEDLKRSIDRVRTEAVEPFTFLSNIADDVELRVPRDTDIDIQLSALSQQIQLNKSLLEKTNNRIKRINSTGKVSGIDHTADFTVLSPELNKVVEAFNATLSTVSKVKEIISKTSETLHYE